MLNLKEKLLSGWIGERILTDGRVLQVESFGAAYRCLSVEVPALSGTGGPGDKVQVFLPGVGTRTYTPFGFRRDAGSFQLLAYLHGRGPGSAWARSVEPGDEVRFIGPETSLRFASMSAPVALLGDETSLAVARTLLDAQGQQAMVTLEVEDIESAREACARIGLPESALVKRASGDDFYALTQRLVAWAGLRGTIVLTGCAQTIREVRAELRKVDGKPPERAKAYWSQGKAGLD